MTQPDGFKVAGKENWVCKLTNLCRGGELLKNSNLKFKHMHAFNFGEANLKTNSYGRCWCINTNAIGVNVQVYTTNNKVMSIQDRLHRD